MTTYEDLPIEIRLYILQTFQESSRFEWFKRKTLSLLEALDDRNLLALPDVATGVIPISASLYGMVFINDVRASGSQATFTASRQHSLRMMAGSGIDNECIGLRHVNGKWYLCWDPAPSTTIGKIYFFRWRSL